MTKPRRKQKGNGPEFVKWFSPLLECLHELGAVKPREAADWIAKKEAVSPEEREIQNQNGGERFLNQVCFARQYLVWEGLIDGSKHGIWSLTPLGTKTHLTYENALEICRKWVKFHAKARSNGNRQSSEDTLSRPTKSEASLIDAEDTQENALLNVLRSLSPTGFEHFCRHLLLAHGFEKVTITQRSRDGGIDGEGILQTNPFVSSVVVFQCKKYASTVSSDDVQKLRGAAGGKADKAILITTGTFSGPAQTEASRTTPRIELIGLKPRTAYDIDHEFFTQFPD